MEVKKDFIEMKKDLLFESHLTNLKGDVCRTLHAEIHALHDASNMLLDDELSNDAKALSTLKSTITRVATLLSMRECLDTI